MPTSEPPKARIVVVEDHPIFRERLVQIINRDPEMVVTGEADSPAAALEIIAAQRPDLVLADLTLRGSDGLELIRSLKSLGLPVPVLVLSMHPEKLYAERALQAGALGYLTKDEEAAEVVRAIKKILAGGIHVSSRLMSSIIHRLSRGTTVPQSGLIHRLTNRELEIFRLFGTGHNTRKIADLLSISENTVCTYRSRIKEKLDVENFHELYSLAARWVKETEP